MEISCHEHKGIVTLFLKGRLDSIGAEQLEKEVEKLISQIEPKLILDYAQVSYISSSGLRVIVKFAKQLRVAGKEFELINVNSDVYKVFKLTGFTGIINISRSESGQNAGLGEGRC